MRRWPVLLLVLVGVLAPSLVLSARPAAAWTGGAPTALEFTSTFLRGSVGTTTVAGGASSAAAAAGVTSGGTGTVLATGTTVGAGGAAVVALGGLALGFAIGDGVVSAINLTRSRSDQLVPLSSMLLGAITPDPAYVPEAGSSVGGGRDHVCVSPGSGSLECDGAPNYYGVFSITGASLSAGTLTWTWTWRGGYQSQTGFLLCRTPSGELWHTANAAYHDFATGASFTDSATDAQCPAGGAPAGSVVVGFVIGNGGSSTTDAGPDDRTAGRAYVIFDGAAVQPQRALEMRATCAGQVVTARSGTFTEGQATWPAIPSAACSGAVVPSRVEVWEVAPAGDAPDKLLSSWDAPSVAPELAPRPGARLDLARVGPDGSAVSCFSVPGPCAEWWDDPSKSEHYRCTYGGAAVDLSECSVYRPTFDPSARTPYADPATGEVPAPSASADPATGSSAVPGAEGSSDDAEARRCWPSGWKALNPLEWVYRPIVCAFVPSSAGVERIGQLRDLAVSKPPTSVVVPYFGAAASLVGGATGGCSALPDFSPAQDGSARLPCAPPDSTVWRALYGLCQFGIITVMVLVLVKWVAASFGRPGAVGD